jgi:hypothetical protein
MNRRTLAPVLFILALLCIGYAIYRSTAVTQTVIQNNLPTVYGEPQHGLLLGLCIIGAVCIGVGSWLIATEPPVVRKDREVEQRTDYSRRTLA